MSVKSPNNSGSAYALVSAVKPYLVIEAGQDFGQQLGFTQQELVGRTLKILTGPESNIMLLESLFKGVDALHDKQCRLIVYGKDGGRHDVEVNVSVPSCASAHIQEDTVFVQLHFTVAEEKSGQTDFLDAWDDDENSSEEDLADFEEREEAELHVLRILQECNQKARASILSNCRQNSANQDPASRRGEDPKLFIGQTPLHLIASHARETLLAACLTYKNVGHRCAGTPDAATASADRVRLELILKLAETRMIPEAERWEQRELAAGLVAVWRAVVRGAGRLLAAQLLAEQGA